MNGKICPKCGKINALDQQFCTNCHQDLSKIIVQQPAPLNNHYTKHRSSKVLKIILAICLISIVILVGAGTLRYHGNISQTTTPLTIKWYSINDHRLLRNSYVTTIIDTADVNKYHNYQAVIVPTYRETQRATARKAKRYYQTHPSKRLLIRMQNTGKITVAKISFPSSSQRWFQLKLNQNNYYEGVVTINHCCYLIHIIPDENQP